MQRSVVYLSATIAGAAFLAGLILIHPGIGKRETTLRLAKERAMVARFELTDICLFTEASYLRHPNLADRFAPFQDSPMAQAHFPSESLLFPPKHIFVDNPAAPLKGSAP